MPGRPGISITNLFIAASLCSSAPAWRARSPDDRAIYEHAIAGAGVASEEALFLDDRPENIEGARQAGMKAELFTTWEDFVIEMPGRYQLPAPH